jgi:hypothetical protein
MNLYKFMLSILARICFAIFGGDNPRSMGRWPTTTSKADREKLMPGPETQPGKEPKP